MRRGEPLAPGEHHLVVQVWVRNSRGEFVIHKRSSQLGEAPRLWATTAGWVTAGEDSLEGALRELEEELDIPADPGDLKEVVRRRIGSTLGTAWLLDRDVPLEELPPGSDEVSGIMWATTVEIVDMVRSGEFFDYGAGYFQRLFQAPMVR